MTSGKPVTMLGWPRSKTMPKDKVRKVTTSRQREKTHKVMKEFQQGQLHSGSKHGPKVKSRRQAIAIALSEARKGKR
jgi:hypothetical protein